MAKKKAAASGSLRNATTDDAVRKLLAANDGSMLRRDLARKLGHRPDFASALHRLRRRRAIDIVAHENPGRRLLWRINLLGDTHGTKG